MTTRQERLASSKANQDDEFYTIWEDIALELPNYKDYLKDKRVLCPCDWDEEVEKKLIYVDSPTASAPPHLPREIDISAMLELISNNELDLWKSNFIKYLILKFDEFGLESLSVSGYNPETKAGVRFQDIDYSNYDVIITNPPFSEITETKDDEGNPQEGLISVLFKNNLDFIIIAPQNALTYKDVFSRIKNNEMWIGYHWHLTGFRRPDGTILSKQDNLCRSCLWLTNLPVSLHSDKMILTEEYDPDKYPEYDNYAGIIEVSKGKDIPYDYEGVMGVPITWLPKYNPDQFEIIACSAYSDPDYYGCQPLYVDGKKTYARILIKNRQVEKDDD